MQNMMRRLFFILVVFVPMNVSLAQNTVECQKIFAEYISSLNEYELPKEGKNYFVHMTTSTFPNKTAADYKPASYSNVLL
jgi:hypothetical protein